MKATTTISAVLLAILAAGCPDKAKHDSIELTRKGVDAYNHESWDRAIQHFKDATHKSQANHQAWYNLGQVYSKREDWKEAAEAYQEAVKHDSKNAQYNFLLGQALYEHELQEKIKTKREAMGDLSKAEAALNESIKLEKDLYKAYWYLGRVYRHMDKPKQAAEAWTLGCKLNPHDGPQFAELGQLYFLWDKLDEAIRVLTQGQQYVDDQMAKSEIYYLLGLSYAEKAKVSPGEEKEFLDKAVDAYGKSLALRADRAEAKLQRGIAYAKRGDKSKAQADLDDYLKRGAGTPFERQEATKALYSLSL